MQINNFKTLRQQACLAGPKRVAVVMADDEVALTAISEAVASGIAHAVLVGHVEQMRQKISDLGIDTLVETAAFVHAVDAQSAAEKAVGLARDGEVDLLLKGHLRTDELLHAVLDKAGGLRTGRLLSDVLLYEDGLSGHTRLVGVTDGGINVLPNLEQKKQIIENAVHVMQALGFGQPRIAVMSATEIVTDALPSTLDAQELTAAGKAGAFGKCEVFGPLALDNALLESAAQAKGIISPVAGHADVMVVPNLEAGNILGKAVKYLAHSQVAHVVVGASVPVLIPSRVESADDKLNSIALGVIVHEQ